MNYSSDDLLFAGAIILLAIVVNLAKRFAKPPMALQQWAQEQGFRIIRARYRQFAAGPFSAANVRKEQEVYQVIVGTSDGTQRVGWARCNYAAGAERVEVVWDEILEKTELSLQTQSAD